MRRKFFKKPFLRQPLVLSNRQIKAAQVRVIDQNGKQMGIMTLPQALEVAQSRHCDLIQVTDKVEPPVCKIGELGKYLYQKQKKARAQKQKSSKGLKGIRLSFAISPHDLEVRAAKTAQFLKKGYKVRTEMRLRGRQKQLQNFAREKMQSFLSVLQKMIPYKIERELKREPWGLTILISKAPNE